MHWVCCTHDEVSVRESLELLIRRGGWQPETLESAHEFLTMKPPKPDVVNFDQFLTPLSSNTGETRIVRTLRALGMPTQPIGIGHSSNLTTPSQRIQG